MLAVAVTTTYPSATTMMSSAAINSGKLWTGAVYNMEIINTSARRRLGMILASRSAKYNN